MIIHRVQENKKTTPLKIFLSIFVFILNLIIINQIVKSVVKKLPKSNQDNPYTLFTNGFFVEDSTQDDLVEVNNKLYVNRHVGGSPKYYSQLFQFLPPKENDEFRIIFIGNSQLFHVNTGNRKKIPKRVEELLAQINPKRIIRTINLSCYGMNISEVLLNFTKAQRELNPNMVILAISPRDFVNEETKTDGIAPEYSSPILELPTIKYLVWAHLNEIKSKNVNLDINSFTQFTKTLHRQINLSLDNLLEKNLIYKDRSLLSNKIRSWLITRAHIQSQVNFIEKSLIKSPSIDSPLYENSQFPNVRSFQFKILLDLIGMKNKQVLIYNEPIRPKTKNIYFSQNLYNGRLNFIKNLSQKYTYHFLDLDEKLDNSDFDDWIHLNPNGVDKLAKILTKEINLIINNK